MADGDPQPHLHNPPCSLHCSPPVQMCIATVITDNALSHLTFLAPYVVLVEVGSIVVIVEVTCAHQAIVADVFQMTQCTAADNEDKDVKKMWK